MKNMLRKVFIVPVSWAWEGVLRVFNNCLEVMRAHYSLFAYNGRVSINSINLNISYTTIIAFKGHVKYANHAD